MAIKDDFTSGWTSDNYNTWNNMDQAGRIGLANQYFNTLFAGNPTAAQNAVAQFVNETGNYGSFDNPYASVSSTPASPDNTALASSATLNKQTDNATYEGYGTDSGVHTNEPATMNTVEPVQTAEPAPAETKAESNAQPGISEQTDDKLAGVGGSMLPKRSYSRGNANIKKQQPLQAINTGDKLISNQKAGQSMLGGSTFGMSDKRIKMPLFKIGVKK